MLLAGFHVTRGGRWITANRLCVDSRMSRKRTPESFRPEVDHCEAGERKQGAHRSRGLLTPRPPRFKTCV